MCHSTMDLIRCYKTGFLLIFIFVSLDMDGYVQYVCLSVCLSVHLCFLLIALYLSVYCTVFHNLRGE